MWYHALSAHLDKSKQTRVIVNRDAVSAPRHGFSSETVGLLEFYVLPTSKAISGQSPTCDCTHWWWHHSADPWEIRPPAPWPDITTQSHYPDSGPISPCPILLIRARLESEKCQFDKSSVWLNWKLTPDLSHVISSLYRYDPCAWCSENMTRKINKGTASRRTSAPEACLTKASTQRHRVPTCDSAQSWRLYHCPTGKPGHQHHHLISYSVKLPWHWASQSLPYPNNAKDLARKRQVAIW